MDYATALWLQNDSALDKVQGQEKTGQTFGIIMRIHCFQHVEFEGLGNIENWLSARSHQLTVTRFFADDPLPRPEDMDGLLVMGGPMGANDEAMHPWMAKEKQFIRLAMEKGIRVLGICLGAQLIASAMGARVFRNDHREIGWFPIRLTPDGLSSPLFADFPEEFSVFHWHGDTFDLPAGARHLAWSEACKHQAFSYKDHVLALQFHLDVRESDIADWVKNSGKELKARTYVQSREQILSGKDQWVAIEKKLHLVLDRFMKDT
jgi:GMP synthase-like glutamine amidotransferase